MPAAASRAELAVKKARAEPGLCDPVHIRPRSFLRSTNEQSTVHVPKGHRITDRPGDDAQNGPALSRRDFRQHLCRQLPRRDQRVLQGGRG